MYSARCSSGRRITIWRMNGTAPLLSFPQLPLHAYAAENWARLAHDVGTAFIVASFSGQIYLRLIPGNQWMLKTMFAGYTARA